VIHTLYRRATHTFHTPSWVTSYLLLVFLSSSSLQFVFSEQLRFEHQLRSQLLWFQNGLQVDQTSTNREQRASSKFESQSTNQPCFNQASKATKIQGPSDSRASKSCTEPALRLCFCHHWDPETIQGLKWSPDRSSKRRFLKTKTCHIQRAKSFTQHQTASEKETSQPLLDTIPVLLFDFHCMSQTLKPFLFISTATNRLDIKCHMVQSSQQLFAVIPSCKCK